MGNVWICGQWENVQTQSKYNKSMSFFRQFNKTICATRFTKPNNLLLAGSTTPVYLCESNEPSIDHLNSIKSLLNTIRRLERHASDSNYQTYITSQLQTLNSSLNLYADRCVRYVEMGGRLTAQALANLYACAESLNVNAQWLQVYAQSQIPHLIRNMSVENLIDLKAGLTRSNGSADFLSLVEQQLKTRSQEPYEYVKRAVNESTIFEYGQAPLSHNLLVRAIESKQPVVAYICNKILKMQVDLVGSYLWNKPVGYALD